MFCVTRRFICAAPAGSGLCGSSSLLSLPHPTQLSQADIGGAEWRRAVCRMYRAIFKLHVAQLLPVQRELGDRFVRAEFQRHMGVSERHARIFYESWYGYVMQLSAGMKSREMTDDEYRLLSPEQKERLHELRSHIVQARQTEPNFML